MDLLVAIVLVVGSVIGGIAANMIASELYDRAPSIAQWLVARAVRKLPEDARDRYREEWLSHLDECPGKLGKLSHALGVNLSVRKIGSALSHSAPDTDLGDIFKNPKKIKMLMVGTALMMVGSLPQDILMLMSTDVPIAIKALIVLTWSAGCWLQYSCVKLLKELRSAG